MTDKRTPSRPPDSDALLDRYRESARLDDTTRPAPNVRAAILEQAAAQARLRDEGEAPRVVDDSPRPAANEGRWRLKAFASVMLMGLAGLLAWQVERAPEGELLRDSTSRPAVAPDPAAVARPAEASAASAEPATPSDAASPAETVVAPMATPAAPPAVADERAQPRAAATRQRVEKESAPASKPLPQRMRVPEAARPSSPQPAEAAPAERPIADAPRPGADAAPAQFRSEAFPAAPAANASAKSSAPRAAAPSAALADRSRRAQADGVLDARDEQGRTALVVAIQAGDAQSVRRLLEAGADPRLPDGQGITPLEHARRRGDVRIVELVEAAVERVP